MLCVLCAQRGQGLDASPPAQIRLPRAGAYWEMQRNDIALPARSQYERGLRRGHRVLIMGEF